MTPTAVRVRMAARWSQSAFVRGFIDDEDDRRPRSVRCLMSQSAFVRGFIDDTVHGG